MSIVLHHHPWSRAATVVWMLEEVGVPYTLRFVDLMAGEQASPELRRLNGMGKLPVLVDGDTVISETAAIGVWLADRHALGSLAPLLDDPARGPYLRWCFFGPSVVEPGCLAKSAGWTFKASAAGFGSWDRMMETLDDALRDGPWLLGERFTMADVVLGGTLRFMLRFRMIDDIPSIRAYADRLSERPAAKAADARNAEVAEAHGIRMG